MEFKHKALINKGCFSLPEPVTQLNCRILFRCWFKFSLNSDKFAPYLCFIMNEARSAHKFPGVLEESTAKLNILCVAASLTEDHTKSRHSYFKMLHKSGERI